MRWRLYGEEGLAKKEADLWLREETLTIEYAGEPLSGYEIEYAARSPGRRSGAGRLLRVRRPTLFESSHASGQPRLFGLDQILGDDGWLKAIKLDEYAPRRPRRSQALQEAHFLYLDAL